MTGHEPREARSITSEIEVPTDPDTAFTAFTEELDLWWVRGPINHRAGGKVLAMRGRLADVRIERLEVTESACCRILEGHS
jgi:hypothetical protein